MTDAVDKALLRVAGRLEAQRSLIRSRLETVPELLAVAELTRSRFAARLTYCRIGSWETGNRREFDATAPRPADPEPIKAYHWRLAR